MRYVIATPEYPPHAGGGIAKFYATLAPALVRAGAEVIVVVSAPFSESFADYSHDGVLVRSVSGEAIAARAREMAHLSAAPQYRHWLAAARASCDAVMTLAPDVVETTDFGLHFVPFVASDAMPPVVVQCHGSLGQIADHEPRRPEIELDLALARLTEAVTLPLADELQTLGSRNAAEWTERLGRSVRVVPPPLVLTPVSADGSLEAADGLVVGRIQSWKGPEVLCRAMRALADRFSVAWVGRDTDTAPDGGSMHDYLSREYADTWGRRVMPVGQRSHADVARLQRRARVAIVPSTWDVYNLTAAEAMLAERVVVCSTGAGASDLVESGVNGFVCAADDAGALADAIGRATALSSADAQAMGQRARESAVRLLDVDASARARLEAARALTVAPPERARVPDWIQSFVSGHPSAQVSDAFLDQVSLRDLTQYLGRRAGERLRRRVSFIASKSVS